MKLLEIRDLVLDILENKYGGVAFPNGILAMHIKWGIWQRIVVFDVFNGERGSISWDERIHWSLGQEEFDVMKVGYKVFGLRQMNYDMRLRSWRFLVPYLIWWYVMEDGNLDVDLPKKYWPVSLKRSETDGKIFAVDYNTDMVVIHKDRFGIDIVDVYGKSVAITVLV